MGLKNMIPRSRQNPALKPVRPPKGHYFFAGRVFPRITWYKDKNLRKLYIYIVILILSNTANGFDGSMMNGLQTLSYWRDYFDNPTGSLLGLFNASMSLGSMLGLFFVPYTIDRFGRKVGIIIGCLIMVSLSKTSYKKNLLIEIKVSCGRPAVWGTELWNVHRRPRASRIWRQYCPWIGPSSHRGDCSSTGSCYSGNLECRILSFRSFYSFLDDLWYFTNSGMEILPVFSETLLIMTLQE